MRRDFPENRLSHQGDRNISDESMCAGCGEVVPKQRRYTSNSIASECVFYRLKLHALSHLVHTIATICFTYPICVDILTLNALHQMLLTAHHHDTYTSQRLPSRHHRHQLPHPRKMTQHHRTLCL